MRSPSEMRIIQIDITNACIHQCSNCTRFCGHHKAPFFMEWEMFKKSADSLLDFGNCIGIMGGEPTLHPQFERFARYLAKVYPAKHRIPTSNQPIPALSNYIRDKNYLQHECLNRYQGPGLWSTACKQYFKHYGLIQEAFSYQSINDHNNPSLHQPVLISRKDLGIPDDQWFPLRDSCPLQDQWSATITPKGAFFCEIAGALDMLFNGPGGWKVEPGWWKRTPDEFGDQLQWCELCGGALFQQGRLASEEIDDVSPSLLKKLEEVGSPKLRRGAVSVLQNLTGYDGQEMPNTRRRYLSDFTKRVSACNQAIYPDGISTILPAPDCAFGAQMNQALAQAETGWVYLPEAPESHLDEQMVERLKQVVLNPEVLYRIDKEGESGWLFHRRAKALRQAGFDGIAHCVSREAFLAFWPEEQGCVLASAFDQFQNPDLEVWAAYAQSAAAEHQDEIERCLKKIRSDYQ